MTTIPDLEPLDEHGIDAAVVAIGKYCDQTSPAGRYARVAVRAYLAARSTVPEAGKAVDETLTALAGFLVFLKDMRFTGSWDVPTLNRAIEVGEAIVSQSFPATPAPAEPGEYADLIAILEECAEMTADGSQSSLTRFWHKEVAKTTSETCAKAAAALTASEAEAASLRRDLEETIRDRDEKIARALNQADIEAERAGNALNDLETAERKLEEHRTALEPFGSAANHFDQYDAANGETVLVNLSLNDLRRARTLSGASE